LNEAHVRELQDEMQHSHQRSDDFTGAWLVDLANLVSEAKLAPVYSNICFPSQLFLRPTCSCENCAKQKVSVEQHATTLTLVAFPMALVGST